MNPLSWLVAEILTLHGPAAYALVGGLAFSEAAIFIGFVLPGETAVLLGGVLANQHQVSLTGVAAAAISGAIIGDSVGFQVGRRWGPRLLRAHLFSKRQAALQHGLAAVRRHGGRAVFLARFTAFFRAVMPGLAGMARMSYRRFLVYNAAGGLVWAGSFTLLGFFAGASYEAVDRVAGRASGALLTLTALAALVVIAKRRWRPHHIRAFK